ncbi:MAG: hypothetical protein ABSF73_09285, partial [Terriglobia bacterium]
KVGNGHPAAVADHFSLVPGQKKAAQATLPVRRGAGQPHNASGTSYPSGCSRLPDFQASPAALKFGDFGF